MMYNYSVSDSELLPYVIRDRKWKNGYLKILAKAVCQKEPITAYLDFSSKKDWDKWIKRIETEIGKN